MEKNPAQKPMKKQDFAVELSCMMHEDGLLAKLRAEYADGNAHPELQAFNRGLDVAINIIQSHPAHDVDVERLRELIEAIDAFFNVDVWVKGLVAEMELLDKAEARVKAAIASLKEQP